MALDLTFGKKYGGYILLAKLNGHWIVGVGNDDKENHKFTKFTEKYPKVKFQLCMAHKEFYDEVSKKELSILEFEENRLQLKLFNYGEHFTKNK